MKPFWMGEIDFLSAPISSWPKILMCIEEMDIREAQGWYYWYSPDEFPAGPYPTWREAEMAIRNEEI